MKRDFKKIGANVKSRKVFVWACYVRQKESTSVTWI